MPTQTVDNLVRQFSIAVSVGFNQKYKDFSPRLGESIFKFDSGVVPETNFPFWSFIGGMTKFKGARKHRDFPVSKNYIIQNEEWDNSVDIKLADFERASFSGNPLSALEVYKMRIEDMGKQAKQHPTELAFDYMEAGETNEFGLGFDGVPFFATNHTYLDTITAQSNLLTGSGVTASNIKADLLNLVLTKFNSYSYLLGADKDMKPRTFNSDVMLNSKILIVAPHEMTGVLTDLQGSVLLNNSTNVVAGFQFITLPFADPNDWYALLLDETTEKPFINPTEKIVQLDSPNPQGELIKENKKLSWGAYGRYGFGYGVWWKGIKVTNA